MIHLHSNMLSSGTNASTSGQTSKAALSQDTLDSFESALSDAVSTTLEKFGIDPSEVKISVTPSDATSGAPVTTGSSTPVRTTPPPPTSSGSTSTTGSSSTSDSSSSATSGPPNGGYDPFLQAAYNYKPSSGSSTASQPASSSPAPEDPQQAFDDAYWAKQPTAVQALRNMQNPEQRTNLATQLANEGYLIDVPIMVWGWDPSIVTSMRQADGYTWVPSAMQSPIELAPGLPSMGTLAAYDPKNPPPGSIMV
jgi:hypothetical protein